MTKTWEIKNGDVALDIHGRVEEVGGAYKVVQDLKNWLLNDLGYNKFAPHMGSNLDHYVGQEVTAALLNDIRNEVRQALEDYMESQMSDLRLRIEEKGDPYLAIALAQPSSLVKSWTELSVKAIPGAIQINIHFRTFTDDIEEVVLVLNTGIKNYSQFN